MRRLALQLARYGTVGALGVVVDLGLFNLFRATVFEPDRVEAGPILAKVASGVIAIVVVWLGNRYWTFRATRRSHALREALEFFAVALGGLLIGLALGSVFRFTLYKLWVFHPERVGVIDQGRPSPR